MGDKNPISKYNIRQSPGQLNAVVSKKILSDFCCRGSSLEVTTGTTHFSQKAFGQQRVPYVSSLRLLLGVVLCIQQLTWGDQGFFFKLTNADYMRKKWDISISEIRISIYKPNIDFILDRQEWRKYLKCFKAPHKIPH